MNAQIFQLLGALRRITQSMDLHSKFIEHNAGLTLPQLLLLEALNAENAPVGSGRLAQKVSLSPGTVSLILDRLEDRGLIQRMRRLEDRRHVLVSLTPAGQRCVQAAPPLVRDEFIRGFAALDERERTQLVHAVERIAELMRTGDPSPKPQALSSAA